MLLLHFISYSCVVFFFFFQAEDGIRDVAVTGVQTCALPILFRAVRRGAGAGAVKVTIGQRASRSLTLTSEHVKTFAQLTGDYNPLHFDPEFAARTRFGKLVVQGGLTTGLLHALVAMDLPGPGTVFLSQSWKFTAPVYIGDTITAEAEIVSVHAAKPVCQLKVRVTRQTGETVLEGERRVGKECRSRWSPYH